MVDGKLAGWQEAKDLFKVFLFVLILLLSMAFVLPGIFTFAAWSEHFWSRLL